MQQQKTLKQEVVFEGIGVHSGQLARVVLKPAAQDFGIVFTNTAFPDAVFKIGSVIPEVAMQATVLKNSIWALSTTEHLLAAIVATGLDNVLIEVSGFEIPIMDGSAAPFVQGFLDCGFQLQNAVKKYITPKEKLRFEDKAGRFIEIYPAQDKSTDLHISYTADFANKLVGNSQFECLLTPEFFAQNIAPARTFGFLEQLPQMRKLGIAKGTSLGNTVVLSNEGFLNETRFEDECVRHKVLDLIGDLSLLGLSLAGKVIAAKTGHSFNREVVVHYISNPDQWRVI
ncbi:MAG: UDP-3-O-acyl-N-acetylglucosamine deacetylase [Candidatus Babeliales bacterium]|jgi:UDP-3-O-[3-hydroxymyristoyl] N-acetylglucosamine deacetylase